ncbi:hypothetical protein HMI56_002765 [Coelomomyces lativittatus]|nr:hypothetical protein HMI56_002765 [Coelomomyces lativittatus]
MTLLPSSSSSSSFSNDRHPQLTTTRNNTNETHQRTDMAAHAIGQYLLRGWIMTSDICPTLNCGCILMKATSTSSSLVCVLCQPPSNNPHPSLRSTTTITSPPPLPSTPTPTPTLTLTEPTLASSLRPTSSATLPSTNGRCFTCHEVLMIDQYTQVVCTTCGDVPSPLSILQTKFHECMHHFQSISPMEDTRLLHSIQSLQSLLTLMERMKKTTPGLSSSTS